jgi:N-methylhydantoinase A/oxoprolinase/acetone carboxylase beta subunit
MSPGQTLLVGVDVAAPSTDLVLFDKVPGAVRVAKVPTTMRNQTDGDRAGRQGRTDSLRSRSYRRWPEVP